MTTQTGTRDWFALHIFYHNMEKQDDFLLKAIAPALKQLQAEGVADEWFFLRYWEGSPHIRIRFLQPVSASAVERAITGAADAYIAKHPPTMTLTKETFYAGHKFDGVPMEMSELPWYENGTVQSFPYEPEYARYGGVAAMPVSEELFRRSSDLTVNVLASLEGDYSKRLQMALDIMVLTALCLGVRAEELAVFFQHYYGYWQTHVDNPVQLRAKIDQSFDRQRAMLTGRMKALIEFVKTDGEHPIYREWVQALKTAAARYEQVAATDGLDNPFGALPEGEEAVDPVRAAITAICFSQIHMTNNRLGVITPFEHYLGYLIHLTAQDLMTQGEI